MKPEISICCANRVDDYEGDSTQRFIDSVTANCESLHKIGLPYEYIVAEWIPQEQCLYYHPRTKHLFDNYNLKDIVIDQSVALAEGLHPTKFVEYYAKNCAITRSISDVILVTNADIILGDELVQEIANLIKTGINRAHFYRTHLRCQLHPETKARLWTDELHNPAWADSMVCGAYSGDFLLTHRDVMFNDAQGYDETNQAHRHGYQNACDGEMLFQMHRKGITLKFLDSPYYHIHHGKNRQYDSRAYNTAGYSNKENWGMRNYPVRSEVPDKLEIIYYGQAVDQRSI